MITPHEMEQLARFVYHRQVTMIADGLLQVEKAAPAYAVVDMRLDDGNGLDVISTLKNRRPDARGTYFFLIERRVGSSSWSEAHGSGALWENAAQDNGVLYTLPPQGVQEVGFVLPPGDYRVVLDAHAPGRLKPELFQPQVPAGTRWATRNG